MRKFPMHLLEPYIHRSDRQNNLRFLDRDFVLDSIHGISIFTVKNWSATICHSHSWPEHTDHGLRLLLGLYKIGAQDKEKGFNRGKRPYHCQTRWQAEWRVGTLYGGYRFLVGGKVTRYERGVMFYLLEDLYIRCLPCH